MNKNKVLIEQAQVAGLIQQGLALHQGGKLKEAQDLYEQILKIQPNHFDALQLLGTIAIQAKNYDQCVQLLTKALEIKTSYAPTHYNLGIALHALKQFDAAIVSFNKAISLKPSYAEAYNGLGVALQEVKSFDESLISYDKAITIRPQYSEAYNGRGVTLSEMKRYEEALLNYDLAIQFKPDNAIAYNGRGIALQELVRINDARLSFIKALELSPQNSKTLWLLAFLTIHPFFPEGDDPNTSRNRFSIELEQLNEWFNSATLDDAHELVGTSQPFYLAYQELNNKDLMSQYGSMCNQLMFNWQKVNNLQLNKCTKSTKVKIGIVGEHFRYHSVWNTISRGLLLNIDAKNFEVHIFHLGNIVDDETRLAQNQATSFTQNESSLINWANAILVKNIEVLIYPEIGMHPLTSQLANLRLSPIQITTWGHPETSGLPTIDYYLSAELFETEASKNAYTEYLIKLPNLGCSYSRLAITASQLDRHQLGLGINVPILVCPGTLFKYAQKYDWIWAEIAKKLGMCKLIFFNHPVNWALFFKERLEKSFDEVNLNIHDHVIFLPLLVSEDFYALMKFADVFLDTIGFSGFNTAMQAIDCALPIVTREGQFMRGRLASGILKRMGMTELIAMSDYEYIELAVRLAQDKQYRDEVSQKIIDSRHILYDDMKPIRALEDFLISQCRGDMVIPPQKDCIYK